MSVRRLSPALIAVGVSVVIAVGSGVTAFPVAVGALIGNPRDRVGLAVRALGRDGIRRLPLPRCADHGAGSRVAGPVLAGPVLAEPFSPSPSLCATTRRVDRQCGVDSSPSGGEVLVTQVVAVPRSRSSPRGRAGRGRPVRRRHARPRPGRCGPRPACRSCATARSCFALAACPGLLVAGHGGPLGGLRLPPVGAGGADASSRLRFRPSP